MSNTSTDLSKFIYKSLDDIPLVCTTKGQEVAPHQCRPKIVKLYVRSEGDDAVIIIVTYNVPNVGLLRHRELRRAAKAVYPDGTTFDIRDIYDKFKELSTYQKHKEYKDKDYYQVVCFTTEIVAYTEYERV